MASIYDHPETYDLEHAGPEADVEFFVDLARRHRPARLLEVGCGDGRVTIPVAAAAQAWQGVVGGLDPSAQMLARAAARERGVDWVAGDVREPIPGGPYELIFSACSSLSHLLTAEEQRAAWRNAFEALAPGGRFVVAEIMPNYAALADSMRIPPRAVVELDGEFQRGEEKLIRRRSVSYQADLQQMEVHYFYDHAPDGRESENFVNDYAGHVYFPNELRLLFLGAGFEIESVWGGYRRQPFAHASRVMVLGGRRA